MKQKLLGMFCFLIMCTLVGSTVIGAEQDKQNQKDGLKEYEKAYMQQYLNQKDRPKRASVELFHKFESKLEKDFFVRQMLDVFGEQKGALMPNLAVLYIWHLETKTIVLIDGPARAGVPSIRLQMSYKLE